MSDQYFFEVSIMICQTIRKGSDCAFMTAKGCGYNGGVCYEIIESCQGCGRAVQIEAGWYCSSCPEPKIKWRSGPCNLATHVTTTVEVAKTKLNPLKASKRSSR
jgi:hypothetical protein